MQRHRLNRHRADRVVRGVIAADLIDRQELHEPNPISRAHSMNSRNVCNIADSETVLASQREERRENACDLVFRRKIHDQTNDEGRAGMALNDKPIEI